MDITTKIKNILKGKAWIVGGAIRDYILKKKIKDIDIIVAGNINDIKKISNQISQNLNTSSFPLDKERGIWRINIKNSNLTIDISPIENDIETDLKKRDFSINSLAISIDYIKKIARHNEKFLISIDRNKIIDISGGIKDLENKKIKSNSEEVFINDPLRLLRAFRFAAILNFNINRQTLEQIEKHKELINKVAGERIREELMHILENPKSSIYLEKMKKINLLFTLFPELKLQEECAQIYYGNGGVLKHTFNVIKRMELILSNPKKFLSKYNKLNLTEKDKKLLKLTALFHDIAKPHTAKEINGRLRFFGHEEYGAKLTSEIMSKLRYSNEEIKFVSKCIYHHLRVGNLAYNNNISDRAIFRFFIDTSPYTLPLLILSIADYASYIPEKTLTKNSNIIKSKPFEIKEQKLPNTGLKKTIRFMQVANCLIKYYFKKSSDIYQKSLINGFDVMKNLNIKEGPQVGYILKRVKILQFEGKLKTKKQAISYIKTLKIPSDINKK